MDNNNLERRPTVARLQKFARRTLFSSVECTFPRTPSAIKGLTEVAPSRARRKKEWKKERGEGRRGGKTTGKLSPGGDDGGGGGGQGALGRRPPAPVRPPQCLA